MIEKIGPKALEIALAKAQQAAETHPVTGGVESGGGKKDAVSLSSQARELSMALQAVQRAPDVRADKVARLRQQVQDGTYEVSLEEMADGLLRGTPNE